MGGSDPFGLGNGGQNTKKCGGAREFQVVLTGDDEELEEIYNECDEDDEVYIYLIEDELPSLEVRISSNDFLIGLVPTEYIQLLACMRRGWKYSGKIISVSGDIYEPIIWVKVIGNK